MWCWRVLVSAPPPPPAASLVALRCLGARRRPNRSEGKVTAAVVVRRASGRILAARSTIGQRSSAAGFALPDGPRWCPYEGGAPPSDARPDGKKKGGDASRRLAASISFSNSRSWVSMHDDGGIGMLLGRKEAGRQLLRLRPRVPSTAGRAPPARLLLDARLSSIPPKPPPILPPQ